MAVQRRWPSAIFRNDSVLGISSSAICFQVNAVHTASASRIFVFIAFFADFSVACLGLPVVCGSTGSFVVPDVKTHQPEPDATNVTIIRNSVYLFYTNM